MVKKAFRLGAQGEQRPKMMSNNGIAKELQFSLQTVRRLIDSGAMPEPYRIGRLLRTPRETFEKWVDLGCPDLRNESKQAEFKNEKPLRGSKAKNVVKEQKVAELLATAKDRGLKLQVATELMQQESDSND
jgi:excisionase family DNA binding protein